METGKVKFFDTIKMFGFIMGDNGKDYFFGADDKSETLYRGDRVMFLTVETRRGIKATSIVKVDG